MNSLSEMKFNLKFALLAKIDFVWVSRNSNCAGIRIPMLEIRSRMAHRYTCLGSETKLKRTRFLSSGKPQFAMDRMS